MIIFGWPANQFFRLFLIFVFGSWIIIVIFGNHKFLSNGLKEKRKKEHLKCNLDIYLVYRYKLVVELWNTGHYYLCIVVLKCTHHSQLFKKSISTFSSHYYYLEEVCSKLLPVFTTLAFCPFFIFFFHLSKKSRVHYFKCMFEKEEKTLCLVIQDDGTVGI